MSSALFIALEREIEDFDAFVNGKALAKHDKKLAADCKALGLPSLDDFFSQSPDEAADFLEGEGVDVEELDLPDEKWFPAADGLAVVTGLLQHYNSNPREIDESVIADLNEFVVVLSKAHQNGIKWHLEIDF